MRREGSQPGSGEASSGVARIQDEFSRPRLSSGTLRVVAPGPLATVQDRGRVGYRDRGVPQSGPFDAWSAAVANALAGNPPGVAVVELTGFGGTFEAEEIVDLAIAGAAMKWSSERRDEFGNIVVRADPASGSVVRLRDVARIELGALQYASTGFFGKTPAVVLGVFQQPGSNALKLQADVTATMEKLKARFPKGIDYGMHYDTTKFVSASMHDVVITLAEALILVILVVYVFLQSWRTTIIPTIAIPVSWSRRSP